MEIKCVLFSIVELHYICLCKQYEMHLIKWPILLLSHFNQIWIFSADFNMSVQRPIPRKSVKRKRIWYTRTGRRTDIMTKLLGGLRNLREGA
jgi:hypothetical protein